VNPCLLGAREALEVKEIPADAKPVAFAKIPAFDQLTEYAYQTPPTQTKGGISVGVMVAKCAVDAVKAEPGVMPIDEKILAVDVAEEVL
jgi:hypothetical protein